MTITQKGIESQLAGDLWNAQTRRKRNKRLLCFIMALYQAARACTELLRMRQLLERGEHWQQPNLDIDATIKNVLDNMARHRETHSSSLVGCNFQWRVFCRCFEKLSEQGPGFALDSTAEQIIKQRDKLDVVNNHIVSAAKRDLGDSWAAESMTSDTCA